MRKEVKRGNVFSTVGEGEEKGQAKRREKRGGGRREEGGVEREQRRKRVSGIPIETPEMDVKWGFDVATFKHRTFTRLNRAWRIIRLTVNVQTNHIFKAGCVGRPPT